MSYAQKLGLPKLPLGDNIVTDKSALTLLAEDTTEKIIASHDEVECYVRLAILEDYCSVVKSRLKENVVAALRKTPFVHDTLSLTTTHTAKYDYSDNDEWQKLTAEEEKFALHRKAIEEAMRKSGTAKKVSETEVPKFSLGKK